MTHGLARAPSAPPRLRLSSADFPKPPQLLGVAAQISEPSPPGANCQRMDRNSDASPVTFLLSFFCHSHPGSIVHSPHQSSLRRRTRPLEHRPHSRSHLRDLPCSTGRIYLRILSAQKRPPRFAMPFWSRARDDSMTYRSSRQEFWPLKDLSDGAQRTLEALKDV